MIFIDYVKLIEAEYIKKLHNILEQLPFFCKEFFVSIAQSTAPKTRVGYALDIKTFFYFLINEVEHFYQKDIKDISIEDLKTIDNKLIEEFLLYLSCYKKEDKFYNIITILNEEKGKSRKLASIRRLFAYLYKNKYIYANPVSLVETPKIHQKSITFLEPDEVARLLDLVEEGKELTDAQKKYHKYNKTRDFAIITLLLGTGMRVSECVGIDINHIDFKTNSIKITRKGGNEVILYFGEEVFDALYEYLKHRELIEPLKGHEDAFFLSMQKRRINVRTVQNLVQKYAKIITPLKKISPHKLRSTYGTNLYEETGDIYLVADVLGHADVNTTKKHYARMSDENRRKAGRIIKLRK